MNPKDIMKEIQVLQTLPIFRESSANIYIFKKAERISIALHMVTNHVSDLEPAKKDIRKYALELISHSAAYIQAESFGRRNVIRDIARVALTLSSVLETLSATGIISEMNASIIRNELHVFIRIAEGESEVDNIKEKIDPELFNVPAVSSTVAVQQQRPKVRVVGSAARESNQTDRGVKDSNQTNGRSAPSGVSRTTSIIELLKTKTNLTVKDFMDVVTGCSEKTIQRELVRLVSVGTLVKEGERRWTRYSLAATA